MRRVLVVYNSKNGQTEKISYYVKLKFEELGSFCEIHDITSFEPELHRYDTIVVGGPVYAGKFNKQLISWAKRNRDELNEKKLAFFTVTLNAADQHAKARSDDKRLIQEFLDSTGLRPSYAASLAGALKYLNYNWLMRLILKRISRKAGGPTDTSKNYEMTNWNKVDSFVLAVHQQNTASDFAIHKFALKSVNSSVAIEKPAF